MVARGEGERGIGEKSEILLNSHRDVKYSLGNTVNNIVDTIINKIAANQIEQQ